MALTIKGNQKNVWETRHVYTRHYATSRVELFDSSKSKDYRESGRFDMPFFPQGVKSAKKNRKSLSPRTEESNYQKKTLKIRTLFPDLHM